MSNSNGTEAFYGRRQTLHLLVTSNLFRDIPACLHGGHGFFPSSLVRWLVAVLRYILDCVEQYNLWSDDNLHAYFQFRIAFSSSFVIAGITRLRKKTLSGYRFTMIVPFYLRFPVLGGSRAFPISVANPAKDGSGLCFFA
jgi:hypothetical protein